MDHTRHASIFNASHLEVSIVGCGGMGRRHLTGVAALYNSDFRNIDLVAVCDLNRQNADDLADTTMNPEQRVIVQVQLDDAMEAERIFSILMGDKVEPRRRFIEEHAKETTDIDWHC